MKEQQKLGIKDVSRGDAEARSVADYKFEPIRGQPMLRWAGKRPFTSTQFFPAQEKERHGDEVNGWMNELYWERRQKARFREDGSSACNGDAEARAPPL